LITPGQDFIFRADAASRCSSEAKNPRFDTSTMEMTRRVMTNVPSPAGSRAPMGQLVRMRHYPDASFRDVTAPDADTLYTAARVDVGKEPWVTTSPT
jgi:hypothetical protein